MIFPPGMKWTDLAFDADGFCRVTACTCGVAVPAAEVPFGAANRGQSDEHDVLRDEIARQ
jgi:hypothetical protein